MPQKREITNPRINSKDNNKFIKKSLEINNLKFQSRYMNNKNDIVINDKRIYTTKKTSQNKINRKSTESEANLNSRKIKNFNEHEVITEGKDSIFTNSQNCLYKTIDVNSVRGSGSKPKSFKVEVYKDEVPVNGLTNEKLEAIEFKKRLLFSMIRNQKIPKEIISIMHKRTCIGINKCQQLERIAEEILSTYDIIIQPEYSFGSLMTNRKPDEPIITQQSIEKLSEKPKKLNPIKPIIESNIIKRKIITKLNTARNINHPLKHFIIDEIKIEEEKYFKVVKDSKINRIFYLINKYASLTFRNKEHGYDLKTINALHLRLELGKPIKSDEDMKSREIICKIKESLLRRLYSVLNTENSYNVCIGSGLPKYFVGPGNNSPLVKSIMRCRWWWSQSNDFHITNNLIWTQTIRRDYIDSLRVLETSPPIQEGYPKLSNHLNGNYYLGFKKCLYKSLTLYYSLINKDTAKIIPITFHIKHGKNDPEYMRFKNVYEEYKAKIKKVENNCKEEISNIWILKPGENSNRGNGITVANDIFTIDQYVSNPAHTCIIQKYIEKPLLFEKRKFDIRCFALITSINGFIKAYYYQEGYLRTSSKDYSVDDLSKSVHLTNEAIQIRYNSFGKHEAGNKVSYNEFTKYLNELNKQKKLDPPIDFQKDILEKIKVNLE